MVKSSHRCHTLLWLKAGRGVIGKLGSPVERFHNLYVSSEYHIGSPAGCNGDGLQYSYKLLQVCACQTLKVAEALGVTFYSLGSLRERKRHHCETIQSSKELGGGEAWRGPRRSTVTMTQEVLLFSRYLTKGSRNDLYFITLKK